MRISEVQEYESEGLSALFGTNASNSQITALASRIDETRGLLARVPPSTVYAFKEIDQLYRMMAKFNLAIVALLNTFIQPSAYVRDESTQEFYRGIRDTYQNTWATKIRPYRDAIVVARNGNLSTVTFPDARYAPTVADILTSARNLIVQLPAIVQVFPVKSTAGLLDDLAEGVRGVYNAVKSILGLAGDALSLVGFFVRNAKWLIGGYIVWKLLPQGSSTSD